MTTFELERARSCTIFARSRFGSWGAGRWSATVGQLQCDINNGPRKAALLQTALPRALNHTTLSTQP
jgi:hypothetical protein